MENKKQSRWSWLFAIVLIPGWLNLLLFSTVCEYYGGSPHYGKEDNGHFFLGKKNRGEKARLTVEVSEVVYTRLSQWEDTVVPTIFLPFGGTAFAVFAWWLIRGEPGEEKKFQDDFVK